ncbi:hypothetical protein [Algibacter sp.]|uniref:hypothetical protein n=1 Tax=Algibacter sp. TaxID=1872428 RepID=UPI003C737E03
MKKIILLFFVILLGIESFAQETQNDTYTIQRLIIYNSNGEILLEKHKNGWMTPALRHNSKLTTNKGLNDLASDFGLTISSPKLSGIFMFISDYKPQSSFRQHYVANSVDGELRLPEGKLDVKWFLPHEAIEMMSLPDAKLIFAVRDMTEQILKYPEIIWGGSFTLWKENDKTVYKTTENFYPIGKVE